LEKRAGLINCLYQETILLQIKQVVISPDLITL
jgi:hypothetical protein